VQRLFSMFASGVPGAALFVLRVSVAATLLEDGTGHGTPVTSLWMLLPIILTATFLCLGLLTPICASLCCLMEFYSLTISGGQDMFHLVMSILTSAVLAMLGPGAYSVDGRIFGRRLLIVPPRQRSPFLTASERLNHLARKEGRPFHSI
jgi:uncharacterized membrane protein YphA (DoxX/SURF4 family)